MTLRSAAGRTSTAALCVSALALAVGVAGCASAPPPISPREPLPPEPTSERENIVSASPRTPPSDGDAYVDGRYTARGWYGSLPSHHDVTLTIDDDTVTAVEITTPAEDQTSLGYQQRFAAALPGAILGRSLDEISIDRLAGSSGCSEGFMDALRQIREQAAP